ncbi:malonyl-coenzyme A:anthocyanin 3-O-glucoside-6''-O-malonyltransferase-like protein [Tanacetum coccineum]
MLKVILLRLLSQSAILILMISQEITLETDKFYHLIPLLGQPDKTSDYTKIPIFSVQVTFFPNRGFSIGMTNQHTLGDASTRFCFLKAWISIARSGTDESFLANGTLPIFDRVAEDPKAAQSYLKFAKYETFNLTFKEDYEHQTLSGPTEKVRATFNLTRHVLNQLKKCVSTQLPNIAYASSFTGPYPSPIPSANFGNYLSGCYALEKTTLITKKEGFVNAAKLLGEALHKTLTNKNGPLLDLGSLGELFADGMPTTMIGVAGTPKLKFYDIDF